MKKLILLLFIPLVFACGNDSKMTPAEMASADAKKVKELECDAQAAGMIGDFEKETQLLIKLNEMQDEMEKKWGDADEKIMKAVENTNDKAVKECEKKIREFSVEERKIGTKDGQKAGKLICKMTMGDIDTAAKIEVEYKEYFEQLDKKYGINGSASDIAEGAYQRELMAALDDCKKNRKMTRDGAIAKLKEAKDLMDLGLMSEEEFKAMRSELKPLIMGDN